MNPTLDAFIDATDSALRTLFAPARATRQPAGLPAAGAPEATPAPALSENERALSGALMRVNHVGEVCAQALYTAQAVTCRDARLRAQLLEAAAEETDHLAWTRQRLDALGSHPSVLNPLWYAGAFALGLAAGRLGTPLGLGFVAETERQVEAHLDGHLSRLPAADTASRAVVQQMKEDEARHARWAEQAGATELPAPAKALMRGAARVMTTVAHRF